MVGRRSELADILRRLADLLEQSSDCELDLILDRMSKLFVEKKLAVRVSRKQARTPIEVSLVASELQLLSSRDDGELLLREKLPVRRELESLARYLNLPVQRDDTVERLRTKIVENTIGSRLRSDAIQGKGS